MTEAQIRELIARAQASTREEFLAATADLPDISPEVLDVVWTAAQILRKVAAERRGDAREE
jgi:hypothetical protein